VRKLSLRSRFNDTLEELNEIFDEANVSGKIEVRLKEIKKQLEDISDEVDSFEADESGLYNLATQVSREKEEDTHEIIRTIHKWATEYYISKGD
jgi:hypothetical protein